MDDDLERIQQATNRCYYYHQLSKKWVMLRVQTRGYNMSPHSGFVRGTDDEELFENWDRW